MIFFFDRERDEDDIPIEDILVEGVANIFLFFFYECSS